MKAEKIIIGVDTDGLYEAENPAHEQFGTGRIIQAVRAAAPKGHRAIISGLLKAVRQHTGRPTLEDDITMMVIQCL